MSTIQLMVENVVTDNLDEATDLFIDIMNEKALVALEAMRKEVAESMFGDAKKEQEDDSDDDKEEDDDKEDSDKSDDVKTKKDGKKITVTVDEETELDEGDFQHTEFSGKTGKYWKSPGEVHGTRKIKGTGYGNQYDTDEDGNDKTGTAPKADPVKRGRGRPRKDAVQGGSSAFNSDAIAALLKSKMGALPKGKSRKIVAKD